VSKPKNPSGEGKESESARCFAASGLVILTLYVQGTRPLAYTRSSGSRTVKESTYTPPRKLSPIERPTSTGDRAPETPEPDVDHHESVYTYSNKIPLPHLERPVYVHFEERPLDEEAELCAV